MKQTIFALFTVLALATIAMAQGDSEVTRGAGRIDRFAPKSITNYTHTKAAITIPLATDVQAYCIYPSAAGTIQFNGTGATRTLAASTEYCRVVRKGITSLVFTGASSAAKTVSVEKQY